MNSATVKEVIVKVNGKDAEQRIANLQIMLDETKRKREELNKKKPAGASWSKKDLQEYERLSKQIDVTQSKLSRLGVKAQEAGDILSRISQSSVRELSRTLKTLQKSLQDVLRGSEEWNVLTEAIRKTREEIAKVEREQKAASEAGVSQLSNWGNKWVGLVTVVDKARDAISGIMDTAMGFYEQYAAMAEHMSSVKKYTGLDEQAVRDLNEAFKQMDTSTPREQLNELAGDAGRLGIQSKQEILDFVQAADQINVALGEDLGEDAVKNIGKLAQLFGDADRLGLKQGMLSTASVINELAQSSSASEGYLMEFTARLAGVGHQAGMTQAQVMAFGSVLDQGMVNVEKGATALQNVITALYTNPAKMAKAATKEAVSVLMTLVAFVSSHIRTIGYLTAAVVAYTAAVKASIVMDKLKVIWTNNIATASKALFATLKANPYGALIAVVAVFIGWLQDEADAAEEARRQQNLHDKLQDGKAQWQDYAAVGMAAMEVAQATAQTAMKKV